MLHRSVDGRAARRFRRGIDGPMAAVPSLHIERGGRRACLGVLAYVPLETGLSGEGVHGQAPRAGHVFLAVAFGAAAGAGRLRRAIAMAAGRPDASGSALNALLQNLRRALRWIITLLTGLPNLENPDRSCKC